MKQYLSPEQTAKLIELGFVKPKSKVLFEVGDDVVIETELIDALYEMIIKLKEEGVI